MSVNYQAFLKDLAKLCKRHGVQIMASNEGFVGIGPAEVRMMGDYPYSCMYIEPRDKSAVLGDLYEDPLKFTWEE